MKHTILLIFLFIFFKSYSLEITKSDLKEFSICTNFKKLGHILQSNLKHVLNYQLPIIPVSQCESLDKAIYLQKCKLCSDGLKDEGFIIKKEYDENKIYIKAKTREGILNGIYAFLEKIGYIRFSKNYEYIPEDFSISSMDIKENPAFEYREIFVKETNNPYFAERFRLNGRLGHRINYPLRFGNNYVLLLSLQDLFDEDIEKFSCGNQIDFTDEEAIYEAEEALKSILKEEMQNKKGKFNVLISPNDVNDYCRNSSSLERIQEGGSPSTPYIDFVSRIAQELKDEFPDVKFFALAYHWSRKPPESYHKLPDNMGIFFSTIDADFSKPLILRNNTYILDDLLKWCKYTNTIYVWHYITNFSNYLIPFPDIYQVADDIKYLSSIPQVKGVLLQGAYDTFGSDMIDIKLYVFSKLLWNPSLNIDKLLEDTLKKIYGSAWEYIQEYIDTLYLYVKNPDVPLFVKTKPDYLNKEILDKLFNILSSAEEKIEKEKLVNLEKLWLGLAVAARLNNRYEGQISRKTIGYLIRRFKISHYAEGKSIDNLRIFLRLNTREASIPVNVETTEKWIDFQELSLNICCSDIIEDRLSSNKLAIAISGSKDDWAVQLNLSTLPEGIWDIYAVVRVQAKDNIEPEDKIAFRYGVYPLDIVEEAPLEDFIDGEYHVVHIGAFKNKNYTVWIAPPKEDYIEYVLVDRIFVIKRSF